MFKWRRRRAPAPIAMECDLRGVADFAEPDIEIPEIEMMDLEEAELFYLREIASKAEHFVQTVAILGSTGKPVFTVNADEHEAANVAILRHAILDLQALLNGEPAPAIALPDRKDMN